MHVAGLSIFAPGNHGAHLDFLTYRKHLAARLHRVRTYRERLVMVPLGLGHPYWIEDPDFDLDLHLHHVALPRPGGWQDCAPSWPTSSVAPWIVHGRCGDDLYRRTGEDRWSAIGVDRPDRQGPSRRY